MRAALAGFGMVVCAVAAVLMIELKLLVFGVVLVVFGLVALVDLAWVIHRKRRGEPG